MKRTVGETRPVVARSALAKSHHVFICYNRADETEARAIFDALVAHRLRPWFDRESIRPGESWPSAVDRGLATSESFAVLIGTHGVSSFQQREMQAILARPNSSIIPVLLSGAPSDAGIPRLLQSRQTADFRASWARGLRDLIWGVTGKRLGEDVLETMLTGRRPKVRRPRPSAKRRKGRRNRDERQMTLPGMGPPPSV